jgi:hypothetical protein
MRYFVLSLFAAACAHRGAVPTPARRIDVAAVAKATGQSPVVSPDGVVRVSWTRTDVDVVIDGSVLPPAAGLVSWAALAPAAGGALLRSDTVVFEDEVTAALDTALAAGLEVTALDSHFLNESPRVFFLHLGGRGNAEYLAGAVRDVWDSARAVRRARAEPSGSFGDLRPQPGAIDAGAIERILGRRAVAQNGVVRIAVPRTGRVHGVRVGGSMGLSTWASFVGSDATASLSGDVILTAAEMQRVLQALRVNGLRVVALHNHLVGEVPTYYFVHFWGTGRAQDLAAALRATLDAQAGGV